MQKTSRSFCLFIALGLVGCSQTNTSVSNIPLQLMKSSAASTGTGSSLAAVPSNLPIDGYRDFKFGMTAPELVAVGKRVCRDFDDSFAETLAGTLVGMECYEVAGKKQDLKFRISPPRSTDNKDPRERILDLIVVKAGPYSNDYLQTLDESLSKEYQKTSQMSEHDIQQVKEGSKDRTGNLYANDQVALVLQKDEGQLNVVMYYCTPDRARILHSDLKKPK